MKRIELKVARIGKARAVHIPAATLARYRIGDSVIMEETIAGILLRPPAAAFARLSFEETAQQMVGGTEDWSEWDATDADGFETAPWQA